MLELPNSDINPESLSHEVKSTETHALRELPIVNQEPVSHDLQENVSDIASVSIAQKSKFFYYNKIKEHWKYTRPKECQKLFHMPNTNLFSLLISSSGRSTEVLL